MTFVMNVVGIDDPAHIRMLCIEFDLDPPVDNDVMKNKIENTIPKDAKAYEFQPGNGGYFKPNHN